MRSRAGKPVAFELGGVREARRNWSILKRAGVRWCGAGGEPRFCYVAELGKISSGAIVLSSFRDQHEWTLRK